MAGKKTVRAGKKVYAYITKRSARKSQVSKAVKNYVKTSFHRMSENKRMTMEFSKNLFNITGGVAGFQANNIIPLCPNSATGGIYTMTQGVGQQQRIGNQIRVKKAYLRGILVPAVYNAISNPSPAPLNVKMWIISMKRNVLQASSADIYQCISNTFFANGNTSLGFLGTLYDLITPHNKDVVNVHYSRTFKLGWADYTGMTGGSSATDPKADNDYKLNHKMTIDITRWLPKRMFFNDTDSGTTSKQVYCVFEAIYYNGASMTAATSPCGFIGGIDLHYEDS